MKDNIPQEEDLLQYLDNGRGNIDLKNRPVVKNEDGSISTVRSMSFNRNGKEILVPTVSEAGKIMSNDEAIQQYDRTGKHLGKFSSVDEANKYAQNLHNQQDSLYSNREENLLQYLPNNSQDQVSQLKANVFASTPIPPDTAAKQYDTFKQTQIPVGIVRTQENQIKQQTELNSIDYDSLVNNFPKVATQLADSNKAGAIRDDIDNLSYFEKIIGETKQTFQSNKAAAETTNLRLKKMFSDVTGKEVLSPIEENELGLYYQDQSKNVDYKLGLFKSKPVEYLAKAPSFILGNIPNVVQTAKTAIPAALGGFIVTGGNPAGATVAGALGAFSANSRRMTADAYDDYKNFVDETGKPIEKSVAAGAAILTGGIGGAIELIPVTVLTAPVRKLFTKKSAEALLKTSAGREYLKNISGAMLTEGAAEGAQEYTNIVFAEAAKYFSEGKFQSFGVDKDKVDTDAILAFLGSPKVQSRVIENTVAGAIGGAGFATGATAISQATKAVEKRQAGEKDKGIISDIVDKVKESKIFKRSPELFKDTTENTLGQQDVYLPAEDVLTFFQTKSPEELEQFYKMVPEAREQIQSAIETGGDIVLKGNNAYAAFANQAFSGLQNFAKLSPETLTEKEAQDTFLNDVVSTVNRDGEVRQKTIESDQVKNNIKNQILGLRLPKADAQDLITTLTSYYDTRSARYGNKEAQGVLDTYLKNLQIQNAPNRRGMIKTGDELDSFINEARKTPSAKKTKPLLKFLKEKGGVKLGSNLAGELNALGLTTKTAPGLFRKENGIGDVDNIPASEFQERFPNVAAQIEGDYISRQAILDLVGREVSGEDISQNIDQDTSNFVQQIEQLGLDLKTATNQEIKDAIKVFQDQTFNQSATNASPSFYNALEKNITDLPQGKGSPEQWQGIIKNLTQKGVKQEEIDWTGIQDWLKEQKGSVTKEQIIDYLRANQIEIEEVVKGQSDITKLEEEFEKAADAVNKSIRKNGPTDPKTEKLRDKRNEIEDKLEEARKGVSNTKFEKYTLPGGENYRELLLKLPEQKIEDEYLRLVDEIDALLEKKKRSILTQEEATTLYEKLALQNSEKFRNKNVRGIGKKIDKVKEGIQNYKSSHFEEPNVLAHIRFNERIDKDGKRVMFIEELQSDWHQEGRKKGYDSNLPASLEIKTGIPDAPFKTTWPELAFKRALLWAVENGFDKIAWTMGEQQVERYDLSKEVDRVIYTHDGRLIAIKLDGDEIIDKSVFENQIEDYVGKEIAKRLLESEPDKENGARELESVDLKVGGEGMKAFYDKIVPTMANKLVKKFGGKTEEIGILTEEGDKFQVVLPTGKVIKTTDNKKSAEATAKDFEGATVEEIDNSTKVHSLEITPAMRDSIQESGLPLFQGKEQSPLGQTQFLGQKPVISLFKNKNRSTLLHELGHVFLQIESEISKLPNVSEQVKKDWKTLEDWLEIKDGKISTESHEKFARGFEAYLREGRAPSIGLRNAFRRFKSWLVAIYKNVKSLNVELSKPVREVFDRMLATDEAIDELKNNPLFRADEKVLALLDEKEKQKYLSVVQNADEKTKEKLLSEALKNLSREKTKSFKEEKQKVRAAIEEELKKAPVYRAFETLRSEDGFKINAADIENYGDFINKLPKDIIAEDGVAVDMVADFLGFADGGAMLNELANAPNFKSEVNRLTNETMAAREVPMEEKVIDESQNDARANKILFELNATNAKVRTFIDTKEAYAQKAKDLIATKQIKDATSSYVFYLAEIKAAREAGIAIGAKDYPKAVEWKKKQLLNHYLYRESLKIKDEVEDLQKRSIRYNKKPVVGKVWIDEEYRQRIVSLLEDFNLVENTIGHQLTNIAELENWKKEQTEEGVLGLINFSEIASFQDKDNIQNLTVEEFQTLDNAISNLGHVGQGLRTLEIDGKRVEIDEIATEIKDNIENNLREREEVRGNLTPKQKLNAAFESFMMPLIKVKNIALKLDGEKPLSTFYNYFVKPVATGELTRNSMIEETYKKLDAIYKKHFGTKAGEISGKKIFIPAVNFSYSKQDMIAFALNWGNGTNRKRIRDGFKYSDAQVNAILSNLTKNEWEFVQDMWDLIGSYFKDVSDLQRKLVGFRPNKVRSVPFVFKTPDGDIVKMKGGYYPLMYDDHLAKDTSEQDLNAVFGNPNSSITFEKSYTKGRSELKVSKKVDLSLKPAFRHLSAVISDIALKEQVWNSYKILNTHKVKQAIGSHAGKETYKQLDVWLKDIFGSGLLGQDAYSGIINAFRAGTTISTMGAKLSTALMQPSGFTQSIVKIGYGNMLKGVLKTLGNGNPIQINKVVHQALEKSKVLKNRSKTYHQDIYDTLRRMERKNIIAKDAIAIYFWPMAKMQMLVDIPTWNGAYYKGLKDFSGNEEKAIDYADLMVVQAQGSGLEQDLAAFERGSAFGQRKSSLVKIFTAFYTYFNAKLNLAAESYRRTNFSKPRDVARFASDFLLLFWLETLIGQMLVGKGPDEDDEENFAAYNLKLVAQTFFSQFPIARESVSAAQGFNGTPSGLSGIEKVTKGGVNVFKELSSEEEIDISKVIEGLNDSAGIVFKYPSNQIDVYIDASQRADQGEEVPIRDYILRPKN